MPAAGALVVLTHGCAPRARTLENPILTVDSAPIALPAPPDAAVALVAGETRLYAIWSEAAGGSAFSVPFRIRSSFRENGEWSAPVTVAGARGERMARGTALFEHGGGAVTACWFEAGDAGGGRIARSTDGGTSWSAPTSLPDDLARVDTPRRWFATSHGRVGLLWVGPIKTLAWKKDEIDMVLFSTERKSFEDSTMLGQWACRACGLSVEPTTRDHLLFSYRATSPSHRLDAGASTVVVQGIDTRGRGTGHRSGYRDAWRVADSPHRSGSGPALATDGARVLFAWYTEVPSPLVKVQFSGNGGRSYRSGIQFPAEAAAHDFSAVWEGNRTVVFTWIEGSRLLARRISIDGATGPHMEIARLDGAATAAPWIGRVGDETFVSWQRPASPRTVLTRIR